MNGFRTTILLAALTALVVWIGQMFGGANGAVIALVFAGAMNFFSYWFSDKIVLKMYGAQEISRQRRSGALRHRSGSHGEGGLAHAEGLHHSRGNAERFRHRA